MSNGSARKSIFGTALKLLKLTAEEWLDDKAPQLGAALAFYTVLSLAPLVLILLAIIGVIFRHDPAGAWTKLTEQMSYFLDKSATRWCRTLHGQLRPPGRVRSPRSSGLLSPSSAQAEYLDSFRMR